MVILLQSWSNFNWVMWTGFDVVIDQVEQANAKKKAKRTFKGFLSKIYQSSTFFWRRYVHTTEIIWVKSRTLLHLSLDYKRQCLLGKDIKSTTGCVQSTPQQLRPLLNLLRHPHQLCWTSSRCDRTFCSLPLLMYLISPSKSEQIDQNMSKTGATKR